MRLLRRAAWQGQLLQSLLMCCWPSAAAEGCHSSCRWQPLRWSCMQPAQLTHGHDRAIAKAKAQHFSANGLHSQNANTATEGYWRWLRHSSSDALTPRL